MKEYTLLMLAHMLGDYYFQPQCLARLKSKNTLYVLIHAAVYAAVMFSTLLIYYSKAYLFAVTVCAVTHAAIDIVKQLLLNGEAKRGSLTVRQDRAAYLIDQALHLSIILVVSFVSALRADGCGIDFLQNGVKSITGIDGFSMLGIVTMLLAVLKPANVFVQKVLVTEKPDETVKTRLRHGGCIGSLERLVIICMLLLGQYSAIALVFTAKSIVRFKDFEDRAFAEYYLYGTLLSVAVSIALFALLKVFGA